MPRCCTKLSTDTGCRVHLDVRLHFTISCSSAGTRTQWSGRRSRRCSGSWKTSSPWRAPSTKRRAAWRSTEIRFAAPCLEIPGRCVKNLFFSNPIDGLVRAWTLICEPEQGKTRRQCKLVAFSGDTLMSKLISDAATCRRSESVLVAHPIEGATLCEKADIMTWKQIIKYINWCT